MTRPIGRRAALAALATTPALPGLALAQAADGPWPSRPIRFIVAFPAGSGTDVNARIFAEAMQAELGQPIVVDNRGGANGFIASEAEFTPKTVQTEKERVKLVFRIKIDLANPQDELKPGMPADATLR